MTTNAFTNLIILAVQREIPGARCWRSNTGGGYPIALMKATLNLLSEGSIGNAIQLLRTARPIRFGIPGLPDIDGWVPGGRRLGIEVKTGRDRQSEEQLTCQKLYERAGCIYVVATDQHEDPVAKCVQEIKSKL